MSLRGQLPCPPPPAPGLPAGTRPGGVDRQGAGGRGLSFTTGPLQFKVTCSGGCPFKGQTQPASSCCSSSPEPGRRSRGKDGPGRSGCAPCPCLPVSTILAADILPYNPGNCSPALNLPVLVHLQSTLRTLGECPRMPRRNPTSDSRTLEYASHQLLPSQLYDPRVSHSWKFLKLVSRESYKAKME